VIGGLLTDLLVKLGVIRLGPSGIPRGCGLYPSDFELLGVVVLIEPPADLAANVLLQTLDLRLNLQRLTLLDIVGPGRLSPGRWAGRFSLFQGALKFPKDLLQARTFSLGRILPSWPTRKGRLHRRRSSSHWATLLILGLLLLA
jgi:hypothetical protein